MPAAPVNLLNPDAIRLPAGDGGSACLLGSRCSVCGTASFPAMPVCPACRSDGTMESAEMGRTARLHSHTIARFMPKGFNAPVFQAFVDLPEGPRIFSLIGAACPVETGVLEDGMEMSLVIEALADTPENGGIFTYKYVPAAGAGAV